MLSHCRCLIVKNFCVFDFCLQAGHPKIFEHRKFPDLQYVLYDGKHLASITLHLVNRQIKNDRSDLMLAIFNLAMGSKAMMS